MLSPEQIADWVRRTGLKFSTFVVRQTPLLNSLLSFRWSAHRQALPKFLTLWVLVSLPVVFAILLSRMPEGETKLSNALGVKLRESINVSEAFVYAAAFISPILYLIIQRYITSRSLGHASLAEQIKRNLAGLFRGYVFLWVLALLVLIATAVAFAAQKTDAAGFQRTFLSEIGEAFAPTLYFFAVFCWYLTICVEFADDDFDYSDASRASEEELVEDFTVRIKHRKTEK